MHEIKAIIKPDRLVQVLDSLHQIADVPGITVSNVTGIGKRQLAGGGSIEYGEVAMTKLEVVVPGTMLAEALDRIRRAAYTGHPGDGKVFVLPVEQSIKIRSHQRGLDAL